MTPDKAVPENQDIEAARQKLERGFEVKTALNETAQMDQHVLDHWNNSKPPKTPEDIAGRLKQLDRAEAALQTPHEVWENPNTGTKTFLHVVRDDTKTRVVDVFQLKDGKVDSYVAVGKLSPSKINAFREGKLIYAR